jgi:hypothetical protein
MICTCGTRIKMFVDHPFTAPADCPLHTPVPTINERFEQLLQCCGQATPADEAPMTLPSLSAPANSIMMPASGNSFPSNPLSDPMTSRFPMPNFPSPVVQNPLTINEPIDTSPMTLPSEIARREAQASAAPTINRNELDNSPMVLPSRQESKNKKRK